MPDELRALVEQATRLGYSIGMNPRCVHITPPDNGRGLHIWHDLIAVPNHIPSNTFTRADVLQGVEQIRDYLQLPQPHQYLH